MKNIILPLLLFLFARPLFAQPVNIAGSGKELHFSVVPDSGYTSEQVIGGRTPAFTETDSLIGARSYWIRFVYENPKADDLDDILTVYPNKSTTLYSLHRETNQWTGHFSGLENSIKPSSLGKHPLHLAGLSKDTFYVKLDASGPNIVNNRFKARLIMVSGQEALAKQQHINTAWLLAIIVLLIFFFNNLFVYFGVKERIVLYYLVMQLGAMLYISSYWDFFTIGKPIVFNHALGNQVYLYGINKLLNHLSILIIFIGLIRLTRTYLKTKVYLPVEDTVLKYALYGYIAFTVAAAALNVFGTYVDLYTWKYDNLFCALLVLAIIVTSVRAYLLKLPHAGPYLLANLLPLIFVFSIPIYHLFISPDNMGNYLLPVLGVISQALGFSVALITRTRAVQEALKSKEMESQQLEFDMKEISYINKLNELQMAEMNATMSLERTRNEHLQQRLELNERELASSALNMVQKSELLTSLRSQIQKLNWMDRYHTKKNVEELNLLLENNIKLDSEWDKFKMHFEQVHPDFFENLKKEHPNLTAREIRLFTYFEMNLSHKEIAVLLDIDQASVRRAKTRLLKKMTQE